MSRAVRDPELTAKLALLQERINHEQTKAQLAQARAGLFQQEIAMLMMEFRRQHNIAEGANVVLAADGNLEWEEPTAQNNGALGSAQDPASA